MANVKFWRGSFTAFTSATKDANTLYFVSDSATGVRQIFRGASQQATPVVSVTEDPASPLQGVFYHNTTNGAIKVYNGSALVTAFPGVVSSVTADGQGVPTAAAVNTAITTAVGNLATQIGGVIHAPVADVTALAAISDSDLSDKMLCFVEDAASLFRYDAQASDAAVQGDIVVPAGDVGRWFRMFTALDDLEISATAPVTYTNGTIALNINSNTLSVVDSNLTVKLVSDDFTADANGIALKDVQRKVTGSHEGEVVTLDANGYVVASGRSVVDTLVGHQSDSDVISAKGVKAAIDAALTWLGE